MPNRHCLLRACLAVASLASLCSCASHEATPPLACELDCAADGSVRQHPPLPAPGGAATLSLTSLGAAHVGEQTAAFRDVIVDVPEGPGIVSISVVATPSDRTSIVVAVDITAPDGSPLLALDVSSATSLETSLFSAPFRAFPWLGAGPFVLSYPGAPQHTLTSGRYRIRYAATPATDVAFDLLVKRVDGEVGAGQLPVTFWFAPQNYLSASTAPSDAAFKTALSAFRDIFAGAGITIGAADYRDITSSDASSYAVIASREEFHRLFSVADGSDAAGLSFFFVESLELDTSGATAVGLANGIPGPPTYSGLPHGGVAVSLAFLQGRPDLVGYVMAHEAGHYLGLSHTTESKGTHFDLLSDTPACTLDADTNHDGIVSPRECATRDGRNLMFWAADLLVGDLTASQTFVMLRSPLVSSP